MDKGIKFFVGLDVHKDSIAVAVAEAGRAPARLHLARFMVDVVEQLDLATIEESYAGRGSDAHHPAMLVALLYATGTFSSRALERASYDSIAFRYVSANTHPDHDTINSFRKRFLKQIESIFVQVLCYAQALGMLKLGTVSLDGTKVHANASRHSAMSYGHGDAVEQRWARRMELGVSGVEPEANKCPLRVKRGQIRSSKSDWTASQLSSVPS